MKKRKIFVRRLKIFSIRTDGSGDVDGDDGSGSGSGDYDDDMEGSGAAAAEDQGDALRDLISLSVNFPFLFTHHFVR